MTHLTVTLSGKLKEAAEQRVASGEFAGAAAYVRDLVRRDQQRRKRRNIEQLLLDRLNRKGVIEMNAEDFGRIRQRLLKRVGNSKRT